MIGFESGLGRCARSLRRISSSDCPKRSGEGFACFSAAEEEEEEEREGVITGLVSIGEGGELGAGVGAGEMCMCETGEDASECARGDSCNLFIGGRMASQSRELSKKSSCSSNVRFCSLLLAAGAPSCCVSGRLAEGVPWEGEMEGVWKCEGGEEEEEEEEGRGRLRSSGGKASRRGVSSE